MHARVGSVFVLTHPPPLVLFAIFSRDLVRRWKRKRERIGPRHERNINFESDRWILSVPSDDHEGRLVPFFLRTGPKLVPFCSLESFSRTARGGRRRTIRYDRERSYLDSREKNEQKVAALLIGDPTRRLNHPLGLFLPFSLIFHFFATRYVLPSR